MGNERERSVTRPVVHIDPARCLGCGQCLTSCPHRALVIRRGLAALANESWCDGRGRCLGHCSADALSLRTRPAKPFCSETGSGGSDAGQGYAPCTEPQARTGLVPTV